MGGKDVDAWELSVCGGVCAVAVSGVYIFGEGGREGGREGGGGRNGVGAGAGIQIEGKGRSSEGGREGGREGGEKALETSL